MHDEHLGLKAVGVFTTKKYVSPYGKKKWNWNLMAKGLRMQKHCTFSS